MKLICPRCMKAVPVPEGFSGTEVTCPTCLKPFDVPARYDPAVLADPAPPPPVPIPPPVPAAVSPPTPSRTPELATMSPEVPPGPAATPAGYVPPIPPVPVPVPVPVPPPAEVAAPAPPLHPPLPGGYVRERAVTINPKVVAWLPAVLLTIQLLLTFFPWVGTYLGGSPVDTQGPWRAMFGSVSRNSALEGRMAGVDMRWLDRVKSDWEFMLPFLAALLAATALAWADRGFQSLDPRQIPPLAKLWPWRRTAVVALATLALVLLVSQSLYGFGMERAIQGVVRENLAAEREEAAKSPDSKARLLALEMREQQDMSRYGLERTTWIDLAVLCNVFAVLAMLLYMRLDRRVGKPNPRVVLQY